MTLKSFPTKCNIQIIDINKEKAAYGIAYHINQVPKIKNLSIVSYINENYPTAIYFDVIQANWDTEEIIKITNGLVKQLIKVDKLNNFT